MVTTKIILHQPQEIRTTPTTPTTHHSQKYLRTPLRRRDASAMHTLIFRHALYESTYLLPLRPWGSPGFAEDAEKAAQRASWVYQNIAANVIGVSKYVSFAWPGDPTLHCLLYTRAARRPGTLVKRGRRISVLLDGYVGPCFTICAVPPPRLILLLPQAQTVHKSNPAARDASKSREEWQGWRTPPD